MSVRRIGDEERHSGSAQVLGLNGRNAPQAALGLTMYPPLTS
jgi:hypothetical protein